MRGVTAAFVVAIAVGGLLSGCAEGPSRVGAAAIVGDTVISIAQVQTWFDRVVADRDRKERARANGQLDDVGRRIVTEAVRHEMLRQVAERENLRFNEKKVDDLLDDLGGPAGAMRTLAREQDAEWLLYDENTIRDRVRDQLIALEIGRKYYESTMVSVHVAEESGSRDDAFGLANRIVADPDSIDDILREVAARGLGTGQESDLWLSNNPQLAAQLPVFAVPAGTVMVLSCSNQPCLTQASPWEVWYIESRRTDAPPADDQSVDRSEVEDTIMANIGERLVATLMYDTRVELSPRYGVWDKVNLEAAQTAGDLKVTTFAVMRSSN
jgi:hypothetical protein